MRGGGEGLRLDPERLGRTDKIRLVRAEEIEHGGQNRRIAEALAQDFRGKAGQRKEAPGPGVAFEQPAERAEGEGLRISGG